MAETHYLDYELFLSDEQEVKTRQTNRSRVNLPRNDPNGVFRTRGWNDFGKLYAGPDRAAAEYSATVMRVGAVAPPNPPYIFSPWLLFTGSQRMPSDVDTFERKSGGWFGISFLFGRTDRYIWRGTYVYAASTTPTEGGVPVSMPLPIVRRRWADGFEIPEHGEGSSGGEGAISTYVTRDASRAPGGLGMRICDPINTQKKHDHVEFRTDGPFQSGWERMYLRLNAAPEQTYYFHFVNNAGGGLNGALLGFTPTRQLIVADRNNSGVINVMGTTTALELGQWYKVDIVYGTGNSGGGSGQSFYKLAIGGAVQLDIAGFPTNGFGVNGNLSPSELGNPLSTAGTATRISLDVDDWIGGDPIVFTANELSHDVLNGSHVVGIFGDQYGPDNDTAHWGQDNAHLLKAVPGRDLVSTQFHASSTASSKLTVDFSADYTLKVAGEPRAINGGFVALTVGILQQENPGRNHGTIAISRDGVFGAENALVQSSALSWDNAAYIPTGLATPERLADVPQLSARFTAGTGTATQFIAGMYMTAEMLGVFGPEDIYDESTATPDQQLAPNMPHMGAYTNTPWSRFGVPPVSPVIIVGGTYVGNDTVTELSFRAPVTWFTVRRVDSVTKNAAKWWSSMVGANGGGTQPYSPEQMIEAFWRKVTPEPVGEEGQEAECILRIVGDDTDSNEAGVTYQYVAFMDPGMRFSMNANDRYPAGTLDRITPYVKPGYLPQGIWFYQPTIGGSTATAMFYSGPGHDAGGAVSDVDAAQLASAIDKTVAGQLTTKSAFHRSTASAGFQDNAFATFRDDDGSSDPGRVNVVRIFEYTGDGSGSRTIQLPTTGKRPMWAFIQGKNAAGIIRDPSHTGTTSHQWSTNGALTLNASTGITGGGLDQINVGSTLNANGVVYDVFIIMGTSTAGNNGWSGNGEEIPVEPIEPPDWPGEDPTDDDPDDEDPEDCLDCPGSGGGGGGGGGNPSEGGGEPGGVDFGAQCVAASQKVCDQALSLLGHSQVLVDVTTDNTPEATMCRLHYEDCVNEVLREFPWDFATKYADLVWVAGTEDAPVNDDWCFTFRVPTDLIFPRRIVRPGIGREFDPTPPKFRQAGADATGRLLFTNYFDPEHVATVAAPYLVQLEYTYRPGCAAGQGDSLFRQALTWMLAHKLAPAVSRNKVTAADCWNMYLHTLERARTVNARAQQATTGQGDPDWLRDRD